MSETLVRTDLRQKVAKEDRLFFGISSAAALFTLAVVFLIVIFLGYRSASTFAQQGLSFITGSTWDNTTENGTFQIWPMLVGSFVVSFLGLIIAVPASIAVAYFIEYMAPKRVARIATSVVDLLAAIPSIVIGLWGMQILTPMAAGWSELLTRHLGFLPFFKNTVGTAYGAPFIAGWTVAIMIIPIITSVSREVISRVDKDLVSAASALGGTKFTTMRRVVIPTAKSGILGGILLGLGRAIGETVAIFFVLNLVFQANYINILEPRGGSIASLIVAKFGEATSSELSALMAAGVILFATTLLVNMAASTIVRRAEARMAS